MTTQPAQSEIVCKVFAIAWSGMTPQRRFFGARDMAIDKAMYFARSSGELGAVSVWVEDDRGEIIWAAGQKARELKDDGHTISEWGFVDA